MQINRPILRYCLVILASVDSLTGVWLLVFDVHVILITISKMLAVRMVWAPEAVLKNGWPTYRSRGYDLAKFIVNTTRLNTEPLCLDHDFGMSDAFVTVFCAIILGYQKWETSNGNIIKLFLLYTWIYFFVWCHHNNMQLKIISSCRQNSGLRDKNGGGCYLVIYLKLLFFHCHLNQSVCYTTYI